MRTKIALTSRQLEQLDLMVRGYTPQQIRKQLGIGNNAYSGRRVRLLEKLGANNDAQLGAFAYQYGYVPFDVQNQVHDGAMDRLDAKRQSAL